MDKQTKIIFVLLTIILILSIIMGLKIAGVIKPAEIKLEDTEETEKVQETQKIEKIDKFEENESVKNDSFKIKLLMFLIQNIMTIIIIISLLFMVLKIGKAKLYRKIDMPNWAVYFQYAYLFLNLLIGVNLGAIINVILVIVFKLITVASLCEYFERLQMPKWWPICLLSGEIFILKEKEILISAILNVIRGTSQNVNINIWIILGIGLILSYLYAHVVSSIRLAKQFDRGIVFTILLIMFPTIFQAVLGFQKE